MQNFSQIQIGGKENSMENWPYLEKGER